MTKTIYPSINGLRAISILVVIVYHLSLMHPVHFSLDRNLFLTACIEFFTDGHLAVNTFFLLSGFLITALLLWEELETTRISLKRFYARRLLRITPAYYFLLLVYFALQELHFISISPASWLTALTYTKHVNWQNDWLTAHAWTLSIEENFYLIWPLIFLTGSKMRKWICFFLIVSAPLVRIYIHFHTISWINELSFFTRIDAIATGCLFALYKDEIVVQLSIHWKKWFYGAICVLFFLRYVPEAFTYLGVDELNVVFIPLGLTHGTIANAAIGIVLFYSIFGPEGIWFKFLNLKVMNFIGVISYSLYLWQQILVSESRIWITQFPQNIFILFLVASASYYFIEKPFLKLKSRFS